MALRACIWSAYRGQNGPNETVWVPCGPAFRAPQGLFRQFHGEVRRRRETPHGRAPIGEGCRHDSEPLVKLLERATTEFSGRLERANKVLHVLEEAEFKLMRP